MYENRKYYTDENYDYIEDDFGIKELATSEFELIEDEIDIQAIKEFNSKYTMNTVEFQLQDKLNEVIRAIKQLDNKINNT